MNLSVPVPPRPDLPPPSPPRRWSAAVVLTIVGAMVLALIAASILREPTERAEPSDEAAYDFLFLRAGGDPIRWNPCEPIAYEVNLAHAPEDALAIVEEAFRRTSQVSGVPFRFVGTTDRTLEEQQASFFDTLADTWEPVLVVWLPREEFRSLFEGANAERHALAVAYPRRGRTAETNDQYASGFIVVDADAAMAPDFSRRYSLGLVLMHEAAHVMGLDHVKAPGEVMFADKDTFPVPLDDWGPGDREGLERLGAGACEDPVPVAR